MIASISHYLIRTTGPVELKSGLLHGENIDNLEIKGILVDKPEGHPGEIGDEVLFQYNAHFEGARIDDLISIPPELFYKIGDRTVNNWLLCRPIEDQDELFEINDRKLGQLDVLFTEQGSFYKTGMRIIHRKNRGHRIEKAYFQTTNTEGFHSLVAVRESDVLMYQE